MIMILSVLLFPCRLQLIRLILPVSLTQMDENQLGSYWGSYQVVGADNNYQVGWGSNQCRSEQYKPGVDIVDNLNEFTQVIIVIQYQFFLWNRIKDC